MEKEMLACVKYIIAVLVAFNTTARCADNISHWSPLPGPPNITSACLVICALVSMATKHPFPKA